MMQDEHWKLSAGVSWQKQYSRTRRLFTSSKLHLNMKKKLVKCQIWKLAF